MYTKYNGRPAYKHQNIDIFLFYAKDPDRWIFEDELGKTTNPSGAQYHGFIRHEGDTKCPEDAGKMWSNVWNTYVIDPTIIVNGGKLISLKTNFANKFTSILLQTMN